MTIKANIHEAKTNLSKLIAAAKQGEEVIISRAGQPEVRLVPIQADEKPKRRQFGAWAGKVWMAPDMDAVDREIAEDFYNSKIFPDGDV